MGYARRILKIADRTPVAMTPRKGRICRLFNKQKGLCALCGEPMTLLLGSPNTATLDHRVPVSRGGSRRTHNLQAACHTCNCAKGDTMPPALSQESPVGDVPSDAAWRARIAAEGLRIVAEGDGHIWVEAKPGRVPGTFCRKCLFMRRADGVCQPCPGPQGLRL